MRTRTLLLTGIIMLMAVHLNAQSVGIGPQLGYFRAQDADNGSLMGGFALRGTFNQYLGAEVSVNYRQEKYADGQLTVHSWPVMITGLFYPLPFLYSGTGFGWYSTTLDYDQDWLPGVEDDKAQRVGWHFGGGLELPVSPKIRVIADYRYVLVNYPFDEEIDADDDMKSNFYVITVGFQYTFYKPPKK